MQVGGIGSGNSGLDNRGVSHQKADRRTDDPVQNAYKYDTAGRGVEEKTTSAYAVSISSEGKRLAAERLGTSGIDPDEEGQSEHGNGQDPAGNTKEQAESLFERLKSVLQSGKDLLLQIWSGGSQDHHEAQITAGTANVQAPVGMASAAPYFNNTSDAGKVKEPLMARIRIRFRDITGQLSERFGGMLSGQFSAESRLGDDRQEEKQAGHTPDSPQKKRHYAEDGVVVDISSADAGHLMDSYDKKGSYGKLTTDRKQ